MSESYIGEIRMFGGNFAPDGWLYCSGQLLSVSDYSELFALIGTTYGGDGQNNFALPNLQGRLPLHKGSGFNPGQTGGSETVTLTSNQLPSHNHPYTATTNTAAAASPSGALPAATASNIYGASAPNTVMDQQGIGQSGGNQSHANMMPYLAVGFIISIYGTYPSQS